MSLGPVMLDLLGPTLEPEERELLAHPLVGGVILFTRNFVDAEQIRVLVEQIHAVRSPRLLVAVDHEGGRVQRFRDGFTRLPAVGRLGRIYEQDRGRARQAATELGWLMAAELRACDIDFSFAPVLDLDRGVSQVIGDRAFHREPRIVAELAYSYTRGMGEAGMAATGKHFPGHGAVAADSHTDIPVDQRSWEAMAEDVTPFARMIANGLAGIMPAHVIYEHVDRRAAGFSPFWLQEVLRGRLGFQGVIFSDDLDMAGAAAAGDDFAARAQTALEAGCDMALVCNNRKAAVEVLDGLGPREDPVAHMRLARMHGRHPVRGAELRADPRWRSAVELAARLGEESGVSFDS